MVSSFIHGVKGVDGDYNLVQDSSNNKSIAKATWLHWISCLSWTLPEANLKILLDKRRGNKGIFIFLLLSFLQGSSDAILSSNRVKGIDGRHFSQIFFSGFADSKIYNPIKYLIFLKYFLALIFIRLVSNFFTTLTKDVCGC